MENESTSGRDRPSCLFIVPLRSIGEEHINSNDFDLSVKGFEKNVDVLNEMKNNNFQVIFTLPLGKLCRETTVVPGLIHGAQETTVADSCRRKSHR